MDDADLIRELGHRAATGHEIETDSARTMLEAAFKGAQMGLATFPVRQRRRGLRQVVLAAASCFVLLASAFVGTPVPASGESLTCGGEAATLVGTSEADVLTIDVPGSVVVTNGGDDQLSVAPGALTAPQTILICEQSGGTPYRLDITPGS
jgi:hypothetical protein